MPDQQQDKHPDKQPGQQQSEQPSQQQDEWLLIGRVVGAHGLNGHIKVQPESDFPERFEVPGDRWLKKPGAEPVQIKLTSGRYLEGKRQYLVKLAGVDDRDQAEDLRSAQLLVKASDRLALDPGEFHVSDLIGLTVVMKADQSTVGTVKDVYTTGHDMLEVVIAPELLEQLTPEATEQNNEVVGTETSGGEDGEKGATATDAAPEVSHPSTRAKAAQKLKRKARRKKKKKAPKTLLIPFVEEIVPTVDVASGRIEITPPPGLIDL